MVYLIVNIILLIEILIILIINNTCLFLDLIQGLRLLHTKVLHSISDIAFNKILDNVNSNLTIHKLKKKINSIIPFEPQRYDTCKNSCIAFTSLYEGLTSCPICNENRFDDNGKPVNTTFFFSLKNA